MQATDDEECAPSLTHRLDLMHMVETAAKGRGFSAVSKVGSGTVLLTEGVFVGWPHGRFSLVEATASLLFRSRRSRVAHTLLANLFPASLSAVPLVRRSQVTDSEVHRIATLVRVWEAGATTNQPPPPSRDDVLRFYFAIECNSFPTGLLVTLSNANHSCLPNCRVDEIEPFPNPVYQLSALRDIEPGEEISISYIDMEANVELGEDRQRYLEEHFLFYCTCERCHVLQPRIGLLADTKDPVYGPTHEDYICTAFSWPDSGSTHVSCANGLVGRLTGHCASCNRTASQKLLDNVTRKADRFLTNLRKMLVDTNGFIETHTEEHSNHTAVAGSGGKSRESSAGTASTVTAEEEAKTQAALKKEGVRLRGLLTGMTKRGKELLHSSHLAFGPIENCMRKLDDFVQNMMNDNGGRGNGGKRSQKKPFVSSLPSTSIDDADVIVSVEEGVFCTIYHNVRSVPVTPTFQLCNVVVHHGNLIIVKLPPFARVLRPSDVTVSKPFYKPSSLPKEEALNCPEFALRPTCVNTATSSYCPDTLHPTSSIKASTFRDAMMARGVTVLMTDIESSFLALFGCKDFFLRAF
ncbi:hypothetical protein BC830DRAFT_1170314 [Chytriomyces sp. MP71]|nr:hypothetical protein BC830DRAFT_1170314 [Chytriomyces sp. MP71]